MDKLKIAALLVTIVIYLDLVQDVVGNSQLFSGQPTPSDSNRNQDHIHKPTNVYRMRDFLEYPKELPFDEWEVYGLKGPSLIRAPPPGYVPFAHRKSSTTVPTTTKPNALQKFLSAPNRKSVKDKDMYHEKKIAKFMEERARQNALRLAAIVLTTRAPHPWYWRPSFQLDEVAKVASTVPSKKESFGQNVLQPLNKLDENVKKNQDRESTMDTKKNDSVDEVFKNHYEGKHGGNNYKYGAENVMKTAENDGENQLKKEKVEDFTKVWNEEDENEETEQNTTTNNDHDKDENGGENEEQDEENQNEENQDEKNQDEENQDEENQDEENQDEENQYEDQNNDETINEERTDEGERAETEHEPLVENSDEYADRDEDGDENGDEPMVQYEDKKSAKMNNVGYKDYNPNVDEIENEDENRYSYNPYPAGKGHSYPNGYSNDIYPTVITHYCSNVAKGNQGKNRYPYDTNPASNGHSYPNIDEEENENNYGYSYDTYPGGNGHYYPNVAKKGNNDEYERHQIQFSSRPYNQIKQKPLRVQSKVRPFQKYLPHEPVDDFGPVFDHNNRHASIGNDDEYERSQLKFSPHSYNQIKQKPLRVKSKVRPFQKYLPHEPVDDFGLGFQHTNHYASNEIDNEYERSQLKFSPRPYNQMKQKPLRVKSKVRPFQKYYPHNPVNGFGPVFDHNNRYTSTENDNEYARHQIKFSPCPYNQFKQKPLRVKSKVRPFQKYLPYEPVDGFGPGFQHTNHHSSLPKQPKRIPSSSHLHRVQTVSREQPRPQQLAVINKALNPPVQNPSGGHLPMKSTKKPIVKVTPRATPKPKPQNSNGKRTSKKILNTVPNGVRVPNRVPFRDPIRFFSN